MGLHEECTSLLAIMSVCMERRCNTVKYVSLTVPGSTTIIFFAVYSGGDPGEQYAFP